MNKFFKKAISFLIVLVLIQIVALLIGNFAISKNNCHIIPPSKSILVLGNSQSECAFNDSLISNVYNFSKSGEPYFYTNIKIRELVKKNPQIKTVFLHYNFENLSDARDTWTWDKSHMQLNVPKYAYAFTLDDWRVLTENNFSDLISVALFQSSLRQAHHFTLSQNARKSLYGGYLWLERNALEKEIQQQKMPSDTGRVILSKTQLQSLNSIIAFLVSRQIDVYLVSTPLHKAFITSSEDSHPKPFLSKQVQYLDLRAFPLSDEDFADITHLNFVGARKFSIFFDQVLRDGLLNAEDKSLFMKARVESYKKNPTSYSRVAR